MNHLTEDSAIKTDEVVDVILNTLKRIDNQLIYHSERVAYIAYELFKRAPFREDLDLKTLTLLSLFHDIGGFKAGTMNQPIWGYLFLKHLSPLHDYADVILHHHTPYKKLQTLNLAHHYYIDIISLADFIDTFIQHQPTSQLRQALIKNSEQFNPELVAQFLKNETMDLIIENLQSDQYLYINQKVRHHWSLTFDEAFNYLKVLAHSVDFRTQHTAAHTMTIVSITLSLAKLLHVSEEDYPKLYLGALLHDIGKVAIPLSILESPHKLTDAQMEIMKQHVLYTEDIIKDVVSPEICRIAIRHHEKLDGTGYPYGLRESDLTLYEQLVAVADILSALICKRSYKEAFSKTKIIEILTNLKETHHLNAQLCELVITHFDTILKEADTSTESILTKYEQLYFEYEQLIAN